jgi:DNA-binding transcriptional LysR family regulator
MEPMVVLCGDNTPLDGPVTTQQLASVPEVFVEWSSEFTRWHQQTLGLHPKLSISIMNHLQQFIEKGNCWSIVPISVAVGLAERLPVKQVEAAFPIPGRCVSIVTALHSEKNTAIQAFCQCLKEIVTEYPQMEVLI